ncbi:MAG: type IX secretion system sortase PorU, partial [Cyclobacteriaceae bacterium]|nr:type IX secretion system sortase PorU [Cyclobacteriaceae bacterium]
MKVQIKIALSLFVCCSLALAARGQVTSVLSSGNWHKFSVENDGVYKIDYELLKKTGINPDQIDPRNIQIFSGGSGMLPQPNNKTRIVDLIQLSLFVSGEADGKFDRGDFIFFFGQGPDKHGYNQQKQIFEYENHLYTDKNFYFLSVGTTPGKRIVNQPTIEGSFPIVREFDDFAYYETEKYNLLKSGRQWFGEQFDNKPEAVIRFDLAGIIDNTPIKMTSHVMAQSISDCSFKVFFNNTPVLDQPIPAIANLQYAIKGRITKDTLVFSSSAVRADAQNTQEVKYQFTRGGTVGISVGYLDFFLFTMKRKLSLYGDQTIFTSAKSLENPVSTFEVTSANSKTMIWDITDPFNTILQSLTLNVSSLLTTVATTSLKRFIAFNSEKTKSPAFEITIKNQNLHAADNKSFIIITHPAFRLEAERLANHRQSKNGLSTLVVTTDQVYHEYAGGKQDVTATRDFVRDVYRKPGSILKNVLLFGRGSYDYKSRVVGNTNFVPIYESLNSLSPLETYSSDDYFGMLEDNEGAWLESPAQNSTMDVGIGRLPVKKIEEAKAVIDKLIEYDTNPKARGAWRKEILFVADDGDGKLHQEQADQMANSIGVSNPELNIKKLYLDSFDQIQRNTGPASPAATRALDLDIRKGKSIVNFTGHGSEKVWMQEQVLTESIVLNWKNSPEYPLFVTATCEFGRNDDPFIISSGERILLQPKGGGIGLVTTARPVFASNNFSLNLAFYTALFSKENNKYRDLGSVFRDTKNTSILSVWNRNFSLLGDPSMTIGFS